MRADDARIVQAARAWALALAALRQIPDPSEAELAMHSAANRVLAFKKAERALYRAIEKAAAPPQALGARERRSGAKSSPPRTLVTVSPSSANGSRSPS
jgi:hypothetical protein